MSIKREREIIKQRFSLILTGLAAVLLFVVRYNQPGLISVSAAIHPMRVEHLTVSDCAKSIEPILH